MTDPNKRGNQQLSNQKQKGILKKENTDPDTSPKKSLKWDEINVTATLHPVGKNYGLMKIDEPPTPYKSGNRPRGINHDDLVKRLEQVKRERNESPSGSPVGTEYEDLSQEEQRKRDLFLKKRKEHYNEFKIAKQSLSKLNDSDGEEN